MKVGIIGLGHMGAGMATSLLRAGHDATVYNRTPGKVQALVEQGAHAAARVADACRGDAVVTMLADDGAVEGVVFGENGVIGSLGKGAIHISMSTISVALSERLAAAHVNAGQRFVAAPVFGRPEAAAAAKLFIVVAGAPDAVRICSPLFEAMGQKTLVVSNEPPAANLVKLSGNFLTASVIEALARPWRSSARPGSIAPISRDPDLHALHRPDVQDVWRAHRRAEVRACGVRGTVGTQGHPPHPRRSGDAARAHAVRERVARPVLDAARPGRRGPRLVGDRGLAARDAGHGDPPSACR